MDYKGQPVVAVVAWGGCWEGGSSKGEAGLSRGMMPRWQMTSLPPTESQARLSETLTLGFPLVLKVSSDPNSLPSEEG